MVKIKKEVKEEVKEKTKFWNFIVCFFKALKIIGAIIGGLISFLFFVFFIMIFGSMFSTIGGELQIPSGNVAIISLNGIITTTGDSGGLFSEDIINSKKIVKLLDKVNKNKDIKAVIFEIDSPGGSPVASEEIANAIKKLNKTTVAVIREVGASGGYWIASAANKVYASKMSVTGSIGVIASRLEFAGLLQNYNITYRRLVAGKYKDAGSPYKEMTEEEQMLYQDLLDKLHDYFIQTVAENRNLSIERVKELATGFIFLGEEAKQVGLIDEIGNREDAIKFIENKLNITAEIAEIKTRQGIFDSFADGMSKNFFYIGKGIGDSMTQTAAISKIEFIT